MSSSCPTTPGIGRLASFLRSGGDPARITGPVADLRAFLDTVPDPRARRGVRHPLTSILLIAASAVAAGARSFTAIGEWAADAPQRLLHHLGARFAPEHQRHVPPDEATVRRVLARLDGDALDTALCAWIEHHRPHHDPATTVLPAIAVDGKSVRGTYPRTGGSGVHLLGALRHGDGTVAAHRQVPTGGELAGFRPLLDTLELTNVVVTADALHTTRAHAHYLHSRGAHYVFTLKTGWNKTYPQLDGLPWHEIPAIEFTETGHGRSERRIVQVTPLGAFLGYPLIDFPHARQAFLVERYTLDHATGTRSAYAALGLTSLPGPHAHPAQIHAYLRGHWEIENRLHWVRDVSFGEDASRVRTGAAPRVMASLRNLTISALRLAGHPNTAAALRALARKPERPLALFGILS